MGTRYDFPVVDGTSNKCYVYVGPLFKRFQMKKEFIFKLCSKVRSSDTLSNRISLRKYLADGDVAEVVSGMIPTC